MWDGRFSMGQPRPIPRGRSQRLQKCLAFYMRAHAMRNSNQMLVVVVVVVVHLYSASRNASNALMLYGDQTILEENVDRVENFW